MFRKIDWFVLLLTFAVVWAAYLLTLAPELTLEDCGELCTGAYYAGIPHPPGYPFWSIYSWLWTEILPFGNVAWRVEVGESFAAAMACGLVGFLVSRGSSMLIEGIEELKSMASKWENAICIVSGIIAGLLLGFDGYMWKESVVINRISLFDVPWLMVVALCLLRWIYAPHQRRYLYIGMFFFGLCATIHQTMLVAAMGIEACIALANSKLGRDLFLGNSVVFGLALMGMASGKLPFMNDLDHTLATLFYAVGFGSIAVTVWLAIQTKSLGTESKAVILMGLCWFLGAAFYFYEPLAGMTNPPMEWGYPRTVDGFFHALSRGQYEKAHPTDIASDPTRFLMQLGLLISGLASNYSWVGLFLALLPFLFILKMQKRERAWVIGLGAIYFCVGILLTILMNTSPDRQSADENKVFFAASHAIVAIMIGYGFALTATYMATHYQSFRKMGLTVGLITLLPALVVLYEAVSYTFYGGAGSLAPMQFLELFICMAGMLVFGALAVRWLLKLKNPTATSSENDSLLFWIFSALGVVFLIASAWLAFFWGDRLDFAEVYQSLPRIFAPHQYSLPVLAALLLLAATVIFLVSLVVYRNRGPLFILLTLLFVLPVWSGMSHWYKSEQRNHWFGYWFGHDMFTPPFGIYPEMTRDAILFGGTDPGRFCPTYMIFCDSFIPHRCQPAFDQKFDRRDVYIITQNALADGTYLDYIRAQYFRSAQQDPPFFREFLKAYWWGLALPAALSALWIILDFWMLGPRRKQNTIIIGSVWGVFVVIVMIYSRGGGFVNGIARAGYNLLDIPFTRLGADIEKRRRAEGVYPPKEIYTPSPDDLNQSFQDYAADLEHRRSIGLQHPGEEGVSFDNGRVQLSGTVPVMMINGLLCKVIFDRNPTNEFFVEESFPLDWMYPYETPFGIIMKINRQPLSSIPPEVFKKDHEFWSKYSERLCGNWITYDTPVQQIADFAKKIYLRHDLSNFTGDPKFVRDDDGQKACSKLRSSIAGVYAWRLDSHFCPPEYQPKNEAERQALIKEADFAFKQAFAFCPYSPEAVFRYVNFLLPLGRFDDAITVAETCAKLDPYNDSVKGLIDQLKSFKAQAGERAQIQDRLQPMEDEARTNPGDFRNVLQLGDFFKQMQQTNAALQLYQQATAVAAAPAMSRTNETVENMTALAQIYAELGNLPKVETVLERVEALDPSRPETHYDLAALKTIFGKNAEALQQLKLAIDLSNARLKTNAAAL
ncbi:MAG TPA: DUF2723 domain-containing protein, partial [Verrucomicrobiae bacterium]|nr:DUF2723 domain-containing protein [Verrucomicrobiae bacterium]